MYNEEFIKFIEKRRLNNEFYNDYIEWSKERKFFPKDKFIDMYIGFIEYHTNKNKNP